MKGSVQKNRNKDDETPEPAPAEDPRAASDAWLNHADAVEQARSIDSPVNAIDSTVNVVDPKKLSTTTNVVVGDRSPTTALLPRAGRPSANAPAT